MKKIDHAVHFTLDEPILDDDYFVWPGYAYVADGKVIESPGSGTVAELKDILGVRESGSAIFRGAACACTTW